MIFQSQLIAGFWTSSNSSWTLPKQTRRGELSGSWSMTSSDTMVLHSWLFNVECWLLTIDFWLLTIGYWLLTIDYWLLTIDYWLPTIDFWPFTVTKNYFPAYRAKPNQQGWRIWSWPVLLDSLLRWSMEDCPWRSSYRCLWTYHPLSAVQP